MARNGMKISLQTFVGTIVFLFLFAFLGLNFYLHTLDMPNLFNLFRADDNTSAVQEEEVVVLLRDKEISLTTREKISFHEELSENWLFPLLVTFKESDGTFTDDEMLRIATIYAANSDADAFHRNTLSGQQGSTVTLANISFLEEYTIRLFNEVIDLDNISYPISYDTIDIPGTFIRYSTFDRGSFAFKVNRLVLNEFTEVYTMYIDNVESEYLEILRNYGEEAAINFMQNFQYDEDKVSATYILEFREIDGKKYFLSLERIVNERFLIPMQIDNSLDAEFIFSLGERELLQTGRRTFVNTHNENYVIYLLISNNRLTDPNSGVVEIHLGNLEEGATAKFLGTFAIVGNELTLTITPNEEYDEEGQAVPVSERVYTITAENQFELDNWTFIPYSLSPLAAHFASLSEALLNN